MEDVYRTRKPLLGDRRDRCDALVALVGAAAVTGFYWWIAARFDSAPTRLEIGALVTSLACVWLVRRQSIWNMPIGIVSCVFAGIFFFRIDLVGQAWLQVAFFIPVQILGWWAWCRAGAGGTELAPTPLSIRGWLVTVGAALLAWTDTLLAALHRVRAAFASLTVTNPRTAQAAL